MSTKLQPHLLLQQQIKGRFLPTSLNHRAETALTFSAMDQQNRRPVILKYYQQNEHRGIQDQIQRGVMLHAQLRSDYIVPLIDFGVHGQYGGVWGVLSREEAPNLTRFVKARDRLDSHEACELLIGLCEALAPLHAEGKIHGNLKPNNIFVKERAGLGLQVLISDILGANLCGVHKINGQRITYNDPSFFTYEQASGKEVTLQTDLGGLGLIAYFMLNGNLPFQGRTTDKILTSVIISSGRIKVKAEELKGNSEQKTQLASLINQCLAKQSSNRPKNLNEFKISLQEIQKLGQESSIQSSPSVSSLGQINSGFSMPNLTPNHSLMNPLGFGQTLGFDAITEQSMSQFQAQQSSALTATGPLSNNSSTSQASSANPRPLSAQITGSHKAIITAPPEGFEAEAFDSLDSFSADQVEHTLMASPHSFNDESETIMGGLSFDQIKDLQEMDIIDESHVKGTSVSASENDLLSEGMLGEDTRPISSEELAQLGLRTSEPETLNTGSEDWGDLSDWNGFTPESDTAIKQTKKLEQNQPYQVQDIDQGIDEIRVDEFELDMLLEQAASALESETAEYDIKGLSSAVDSSFATPDTLSSSDMHQLDWDQHSTLFNQALVIPQVQDQDEEYLELQVSQSQAQSAMGQGSKNDHFASMQKDTDLESTAKLILPDSLKEIIDSKSLSDRFEEDSHGLKPKDLEEVTDSIQVVSEVAIEGKLNIPELFSSPVHSVTHERITDEFELTERINIPSSIDDLDLDDFVVKSAKTSGLFSIPEPIGGEHSQQDVAIQKARTDAVGGEHKSIVQELDTQLEFQRPEEIFPDIPEWRSLVNLKDQPLALSNALLSIPLPLSGQLLPFSQFQLEIEGKEHEEGFFIAGRPTNTHIPVVLEPEVLEEQSESNLVWEPVEQNQDALSDALISAQHDPSTNSKTWLNLLLLVLILFMAAFGLMHNAGMSVQELTELVVGGTTPVTTQSSRAIRLKPIVNSTPKRNNSSRALGSSLQPLDPMNQAQQTDLQPKLRVESQAANNSENETDKEFKKKTSKRSKATSKHSRNGQSKELNRKKSLKKNGNRTSKKTGKKNKKKRRRKKRSTIKDPFAN